MKIVSLNNPDYQIYIGESYRNLCDYLPDKQIIIITDRNVFSYYEDFISQFTYIIIGVGEEIKKWKTVAQITHNLLEEKVDRHSFIIGFGGGVVCDITGFIASIFMRGISFAYVPTTILAQVDATIGGKNGINFYSYKNMLGVFNSPDFVLCDTTFFSSLNKKEIKSGYAEVIKHALIDSPELFAFLSNNYKQLLNLSSDNLEDLIFRSIKIKAKIVQQDFKENYERKKLNFGHTLGHAIENNSNLTHGEAITIGMRFAANLSVKLNYLSENELIQIEDLLTKFSFPLKSNVQSNRIVNFIQKDKKKNRHKIDFILLSKIGQAIIKKLDLKYVEKEISINFKL